MDDCYFGNIMDLVEKKKLVGNTSIYLGLITDAYNPFLNLLKNVRRIINKGKIYKIIFRTSVCMVDSRYFINSALKN